MLGNPYPLKQNAGKSFIGSYVLGMGFVLSPEEAEVLITKDPRNKDVLFPYLNGEDLNNDPEQKPSRWVINFFDWTEEKARTYPDCFEIVERLVKPERQRWKLDENGNEIVGTYALRKPLPQKWWIYGEKRPALYETISKGEQGTNTEQYFYRLHHFYFYIIKISISNYYILHINRENRYKKQLYRNDIFLKFHVIIDLIKRLVHYLSHILPSDPI